MLAVATRARLGLQEAPRPLPFNGGCSGRRHSVSAQATPSLRLRYFANLRQNIASSGPHRQATPSTYGILPTYGKYRRILTVGRITYFHMAAYGICQP